MNQHTLDAMRLINEDKPAYEESELLECIKHLIATSNQQSRYALAGIMATLIASGSPVLARVLPIVQASYKSTITMEDSSTLTSLADDDLFDEIASCPMPAANDGIAKSVVVELRPRLDQEFKVNGAVINNGTDEIFNPNTITVANDHSATDDDALAL